MYKHCNNDEYISLHDCHAAKILFENGVLTFVFDEGFWVTDKHPSNTTDKTVRTGVAEARFYLEFGDETDITVQVFEKRFKQTVRKELELSELIEYVNSGKHTLEFLYQYKGYNSMIVECWLWSDKKPYHRECQLKILLKDAKYCWNDLREDREW